MNKKLKNKPILEKQNHQLTLLLHERTSELEEALERANKLSKVKRSFLSKKAHGFKNPLGYIKLCIDVINKMNEHSDFEEQQKYFGYIKKEVNDLTQLINDVINPIKEEIGEGLFNYERFNLLKFLEDSIPIFQEENKNIPLIQIESIGEDVVHLDKAILHKIIFNLLKIVIQYTEEDILIRLDVKDKSVLIEIEPKSISLSKAKQKKIFNQFLRTDEDSESLEKDLEISILKNYVELLEGIIRIKIKEKDNTVFTIFLPTK